MGKLNIFEISLNNTRGVFYAGQNLLGHCTLELNSELTLRGIRLKFEGRGHVHWTETHQKVTWKYSRSETITFSDSEQYFNQEVLLFGILPSEGRSTSSLSAGRHTFPFCFVLPEDLPSSFEGVHGYVRYVVKAIIDRPWKFDHTTKCNFTVIGILNLNSEPNASMTVQGQNQKTLCCLCCASGPLSAEFSLQRRGYVPGEAVPLSAHIENSSNRLISKSHVDLKMISTFHSTTKSRSVSKEIGRVEEGPIGAGQTFTWDRQQFVIPPLPPSYLNGCRIIDIKYILQLSVVPSGLSKNLEVPLDIIIGTIPLLQVVENNPPRASEPSQALVASDQPSSVTYPMVMGGPGTLSSPPSYSQLPDLPIFPPSYYPDIPPPSYSESMLGSLGVRDEDDQENSVGNPTHMPVYPYYDWGYQPTTMN
ncbi:hypothetical protein C0Q70_19763 [Pomacea canaliculata]|uniref:Arrestin C-terminal-like domain-containing protein n=1 Tax=Pomacea canaliculata TaxID=400727 RepID=A0A2T7NDN3_POMCA|nr:arrestin domain-containing protein 17-like [Pomacea canaliculata]XP_025077681.1 arrestin domain-containing protein 17-like [Pomacea canaliculata]XP_025077682.1 arrestin domain-containing protein 17-like [Pomacea canaliculata]PVD19277.1 hypothetical protein C0Q70_19763 [Pomacea canaliculata]